MQGSAAVVDALNTVYRLLLAIEQQAHAQEHRLEAQGWRRMSDWFHAIEEKGHSHLIHPLMDRINMLGGKVDSQYAFEPECFDFGEIGAALGSMLRRLVEARAAYGEACETAEDADDYVTEKMIWCHLAWLEKKIVKFERRIAKLQALELKPFLAEMMD